MKVVKCHNYYQLRGGEDQSFEDEIALLRKHNVEVVVYTRHSDEITEMSQPSVALQTLWSRRTDRELGELLRRERPDVIHFTNTFPLISSSCYAVARRCSVPIVQALHNYRPICANGCLMRDGRICHQCVGRRFALPAVRYGCYRGSRAASSVVATWQFVNRLRQVWSTQVDAYFTVSSFARERLVEGGIPSDRITVKPNCVQPDPGVGKGDGDYIVFVGRLSPEKGVATLFKAWDKAQVSIGLKIVGAGPLESDAIAFADSRPNVSYTGQLPFSSVLDVVGEAKCLVISSEWYETFGRTIIEAYSKGTPVISSRLGAMQELLIDHETGYLFEPGNEDDLADKIRQVCTLPESDYRAMRRRARAEYERNFTPDANYKMLRAIYDRAIDAHEARRGPQK